MVTDGASAGAAEKGKPAAGAGGMALEKDDLCRTVLSRAVSWTRMSRRRHAFSEPSGQEAGWMASLLPEVAAVNNYISPVSNYG